MPYLLAVSYHVATDKPPAQNGDKFRSVLATIYNQSQLAERKHVARYWSINTAETAIPLSAHPSPLIITMKLAEAILGGRLFGGGVLPAQYCPCDCKPSYVLPQCYRNVFKHSFISWCLVALYFCLLL